MVDGADASHLFAMNPSDDTARDSSQLASESSVSTLGQFYQNKKIKLIPQPRRKPFKKALIERDGVCLVCWLEDFDIIKTAHIIPQGSDFIMNPMMRKLMKMNLILFFRKKK
jgi:hypothetical protein